MKRIAFVVCAVLLVPLVAARGEIGLGAGASGGLEFPIAQDDEAQGSVFAIRAIVVVVPSVALQPNVAFTTYGDPEFDEFDSDLSGSEIAGYGLDAVLGGSFGNPGVWPYGLIGGGFYNTKRDQTGEDETNFGWSAGFGVEVGLSHLLAIDLRGKLLVISPEGGGTKKSASVTGGVNVYFGK